MSRELFCRRSFLPVVVPTLLGQFPCPSAKADILRVFRFSWSFTLHDALHDFWVPIFLCSKGGASSKYFVDNHPESVDIRLLGNPVSTQAKLLRVE